jgi:hypothetical protein
MENNHDHITLTSAELSYLWSTYLMNSMSVCVFKYFLQNIEDNEITQVLLEKGLALGNFLNGKLIKGIILLRLEILINASRRFSYGG